MPTDEEILLSSCQSYVSDYYRWERNNDHLYSLLSSASELIEHANYVLFKYAHKGFIESIPKKDLGTGDK
jgi:hypothetical protein